MKQTNLYTAIVSKRVMRPVFLIAAALFVLYQCDVNMRMDDDIQGEPAYWIAKEGCARSELMRGFRGIGLETYQAVFHRLLIYQGTIMIRLFGWSIHSLHLVGFLYALLFAVVFYRFIRQRFPEEQELYFAAMTILLINHEYAYGAGSFRPEVMLMAIGFCCYYALDTYLRGARCGYGYLLLAGMLGALCFLCHPNGMIFIAAGCMLLVSRNKWGPAFIYGVVASAVFLAIYMADVWAHAEVGWLVKQFRNDPAFSNKDFTWYGPLVKLAEEQARFLYNEREVPFTLALLAALIFGYRYIRQRLGGMLTFIATLVLVLAVYTYSKTPQYLILYLPYFTLIFLNGWKQVEAEGRDYQKWAIRALTLAFVVINTGNVLARGAKNIRAFSQDSTPERNTKLAAHIPGPHSQTDVLAPNSFIFNQLDSFRRIQSTGKYNFYRTFHNEPPLTFNALADSARKYNIRYIIFSEEDVEVFGLKKALQEPGSQLRLLGEEGGEAVIALDGATGTSAPPAR